MEKIVVADIGASNVRIALATKDGILRKIKEKTKSDRASLLKQIARLADFISGDEKPECLIAACAGNLDVKKGEMVSPPNLACKRIPIVKYLSKCLNIPVYLVNDCNAAVLGEKFFGMGKDLENIVYVTLSTGIGGGAIVNNNLLLGKDGNATEIGHTTIDERGRLKCGCGKRGHWEAYCSGKNLMHFLELWFRENRGVPVPAKYKSVEKLFLLARSGDKISLEFLNEVGRLNAIGIANIINVFDPELITLGGALALNNKEQIIHPIKKHLRNYIFNRVPRIAITPLGEDITLYGAIAYYFGFSNKKRVI